MKRRPVVLTSLLAVAACVFSLSAAPRAGALSGSNSPSYRPSTWVPSAFYTQMLNARGNSSADIGYGLHWDKPAYDNLGSNSRKNPEFEVGWKHMTESTACNRNPYTSAQGTTNYGFPNGSYAQRDWTEDKDDAIFAIFGLDVLISDQVQNPSRSYSMTGACHGNPNTFTTPQRAYLQVQLGHYDRYNDVSDSFSDASIDVAPEEESQPYFPSGSSDRSTYYGNFEPNWLHDGNNEQGRNDWNLYNSKYSRFCNQYGPIEGNCYMYVQPTTSGDAWFGQTVGVRSQASRDYNAPHSYGQTGNNTGNQYSSIVRCPTGNPGACTIDVYYKSQSSGTYNGHRWNIPNNGRWYWLAIDSGDTPSSSRTMNYWVNVHRASVDFDGQYLGSGL